MKHYKRKPKLRRVINLYNRVIEYHSPSWIFYKHDGEYYQFAKFKALTP